MDCARRPKAIKTVSHLFAMFRVVEAELLQLAPEQSELLAQVIMEFTGDAAALLFLRAEQPPTDLAEAFLDTTTIRDVDA